MIEGMTRIHDPIEKTVKAHPHSFILYACKMCGKIKCYHVDKKKPTNCSHECSVKYKELLSKRIKI